MKVRIDYTNWKGERATRTIQPMGPNPLFFGSTEHHPDLQWLLKAYDWDKNQDRVFALRDIHSWEPV